MRDAFGNVAPRPSTGQWILRILVAVVCVAFSALSVIHYQRDQKRRAAVNQFVKSFHVAERRPAFADAIKSAPAADLAYEMAANVALQDSTGPLQVSELDPATRKLWKTDMGRVNEELFAARTLLIKALSQRPSWPYHRSLLGMIEYTRGSKQRKFDAQSRYWFRLLVSGMRSAPGDHSLQTFAALALTESWSDLDETGRQEAPLIFRAALANPDFVSNIYPSLVIAVGAARAQSLLPSSAPSLRAAKDLASKAGETPVPLRVFRFDGRRLSGAHVRQT